LHYAKICKKAIKLKFHAKPNQFRRKKQLQGKTPKADTIKLANNKSRNKLKTNKV